MAPPRRPINDRLIEKIEKHGDCWLWTGSLHRDGYGVMGIGRKSNQRVHRVAYREWCGPIPDGHFVCHRCDTPRCINPEHLFIGLPKDNSRDMVMKGRKYAPRGADHHQSILTAEQRKRLVDLRNKGLKLKVIADQFGVSFKLVSAIYYQEVRNAAR